jgi:hypothetical protein
VGRTISPATADRQQATTAINAGSWRRNVLLGVAEVMVDICHSYYPKPAATRAIRRLPAGSQFEIVFE